METLKETTVAIKTDKGDIERPAMVSDLCPGLAISKTSFARFSITHIKSGTKMGTLYQLFGDALLVFSKLALIAKHNDISWDVDSDEVPNILKKINDIPVPFDSTVIHMGKERKQTCKEFFEGLRFEDLHSSIFEPDTEYEALELLEQCKPE